MAQTVDPTPGLLSAFQTKPALLFCTESAAHRDDLQLAIRAVRQCGFEVRVMPTQSPEQTRALVHTHACGGEATLIAGGGDGMLNVFAQAIDEHELCDCTFGILPLGTANDFAASAGIPLDDLVTALRVAIAGTPFEVDVAYLNDQPFMNVATLGRTAEFSSEAEPAMKERFGKWAYVFSALKRMGDSQSAQVRVQAEGLDWSGAALGVMVGNGRQAGGGFSLSAGALIDDGKLDGLIIPEMPLRQAASLAYNMKIKAADLELDHLPTFRAGAVTVTFDSPQAMQIDGEAGQTTEARFRVDPKRVRLRLPRVTDLVTRE